MEILSPSLIHFHISTLLLSEFPWCDAEGLFCFGLETQHPIPGVLALALLREAMHSFLHGILFVFPRQCAVTFLSIMQVWEIFVFLFLITLMFPFVNQGKAFGCKSILGVIFYLFFLVHESNSCRGLLLGVSHLCSQNIYETN